MVVDVAVCVCEAGGGEHHTSGNSLSSPHQHKPYTYKTTAVGQTKVRQEANQAKHSLLYLACNVFSSVAV